MNMEISLDQISFFEDRSIIETKNQIYNSLNNLLQKTTIHIRQKSFIKKFLPTEIDTNLGKITKGENLKGFPYLVLDIPRFFDQKNIFVVRTLLWWGKPINIQFQIMGKYLEMYRFNIKNNINLLENNDFFISKSESPWEHELGIQFYEKILTDNQKEIKQIIKSHQFIKIVKSIPFSQVNNLPYHLEEFCQNLKKIIS